MVSSKWLPSALLFALFATTNAQTLCTSANAYPVESLSSGNSGSSGSSSNAANSIGLDDLDDDIFGSLIGSSNDAAELITSTRTKLRRRAGLACTATEMCFSISKEPFCVNPLTGDFHAQGGKGNIVTGEFVLDDGQKGNLFSSITVTGLATAAPTASPTGRLTGAGNAVSTSSSAVAAATTLSRATTTPSSSGPPAAPTSTTAIGAASSGSKAGLGVVVLALAFGMMIL